MESFTEHFQEERNIFQTWADIGKSTGRENVNPTSHSSTLSPSHFLKSVHVKTVTWHSILQRNPNHSPSQRLHTLLTVRDSEPIYSKQNSTSPEYRFYLTEYATRPRKGSKEPDPVCSSHYLSVWPWAIHLRHLWASLSFLFWNQIGPKMV